MVGLANSHSDQELRGKIPTGTTTSDEILDIYFQAVAESEGYSADEIPAFVERQKALLGKKIRETAGRKSWAEVNARLAEYWKGVKG